MEEMLLGAGGMDFAAYGLDGGIVMAVNEVSNWFKECLEEWDLEKYMKRAYPLFPFGSAFILCFMMSQDFDMAIQHAFKYGLWASFAWRFFKVSLKGE